MQMQMYQAQMTMQMQMQMMGGMQGIQNYQMPTGMPVGGMPVATSLQMPGLQNQTATPDTSAAAQAAQLAMFMNGMPFNPGTTKKK